MKESVPIPEDNSKRIAFRLVVLSGISIVSGAVLIPLTIIWFVQPPSFGYLTPIFTLILLIMIQLGVQKLRYGMEVRWLSIEASFNDYLRNALPSVVFSDIVLLMMIMLMILVSMIEITSIVLLLMANGFLAFILTLVMFLLRTTPRLPRGFRPMKPDEHPLIWNLLEKSKIEVRSVGFLDYPGLKKFNAFQWGIGDNSIIALTDELENVLEEKELAAVAAHELGHVYYGHFPKLLLSSIIPPLFLSDFLLVFLALDLGSTLAEYQKVIFLLCVGFLILGYPTLFIPWITRKWEVKADLFAASLLGKEAITAALQKLVEHNIVYANIPKRLEFLISHPILRTRLDKISSTEDS
ncbi:MAG: M48 family metalloprotease [Candidatus Thorarchaeota archaeon]|nr:M48 family metalloprotease [Candidatus Thorarchaeota archaeon]MCK5239762.1 M48 family metalloprotease [Candidatus Thorarchaeota archaeon]